MSNLIKAMLLSITIATTIAGCGGADEGNPPPSEINSFTPVTKSQVVGRAGADFTMELSDGTSFQVNIPAGALSNDTALTLTTQEPAQGQRFNLRLQPANLLFNNGLSATVTITLPAGQTFPANGALIYDKTLIPYTVLDDGRIEVRIAAFATSSAPVTASLKSTPAFSANTRAAATARKCDMPDIDLEDGEGSLLLVHEVMMDVYGRCMLGAIQDMAANGQFEEALEASQAVGAYMMRDNSGLQSQYVLQSQEIACQAYRSALDKAAAVAVSNLGVLYLTIKPIIFWEAVVQRLGATCPGITPGEYNTITQAKVTAAIAIYDQLKPVLTDTSSADYGEAKTELAESARTKSEVLALSPPNTGVTKSVQTRNQVLTLAPADSVRQTVATEITGRAQDQLLASMLKAPWDKCHNTQDYDGLIYLMQTVIDSDRVRLAAQYCGTHLDVEYRNLQGGVVTSTGETPLGGISATVQRTSGSLRVDKSTGTLELYGPIQALRCPPGDVGSETLSIAIDGKEIQSYTSAPYLNNPLSINLPAALEAAHPGATTKLASAVLTITRNGNACGGFWGASPSPLLSLILSFKDEKIAFSRNGDIYVMNPDGTGVTPLTSGTDSDVEPAWSPDRSKIAFSRQVVGGYYDIYVMNADGSNITPLTVSAGTSLGDRNPAWSANGLKMVFDRYEADFDKNIYVMNSDGTSISALTTSTNAENFDPVWSPDGSKVAYTRYESGPEQIFQTLTDGSGTTSPLSSCVSSCRQPAWSPDGTKIAVGTASGYIHIMNADGSNLQQVPNAQGVRPAWSPDGSKIAFQNGSIYTINLDGTGATPLTSGSEAAW